MQTKLEFNQKVSIQKPSIVRYRSVAIAVVDVHRAIAVIVQLEDVTVPMFPPPSAKLSVPATWKWVKQFPVLHPDHGEEILIAQMPSEVVFLSELGNPPGLQKLVV